MSPPAAPIYLDHTITTPCDPRVVAAMLPYFTERILSPEGNPHPAARLIADAVEEAREDVARLMGARAHEIVFTSGATESNNLALFGIARTASPERRRIVTSSIEHKSVLAPCRELSRHGFELIELSVDRAGRVDLDAAAATINDHTLVVTVQAANGEIGTIQPVKKIAAMAHAQGALFHCDVAQAAGKIAADILAWDADLASVSAHKLYGPKGVGALYVRDGAHTLPIYPLILGGGQEQGLRSGTQNVPGLVGFGEACRICVEELTEEGPRLAELRDRFEAELRACQPEIVVNGALDARLPGISSVTFPDVDGEALVVTIDEVIIGTGAACATGVPEPSPVLLAMHRTDQEAFRSIRIAFGRFNRSDDAGTAARALAEAANRIRAMM